MIIITSPDVYIIIWPNIVSLSLWSITITLFHRGYDHMIPRSYYIVVINSSHLLLYIYHHMNQRRILYIPLRLIIIKIFHCVYIYIIYIYIYIHLIQRISLPLWMIIITSIIVYNHLTQRRLIPLWLIIITFLIVYIVIWFNVVWTIEYSYIPYGVYDHMFEQSFYNVVIYNNLHLTLCI